MLTNEVRSSFGTHRLARATFTTISRNLAWAFCYNILAIPPAAAGLLNPLVAAATMALQISFALVAGLLRKSRCRARPRDRPLIWSLSGLDSGSSPQGASGSD